MMVTFVDTEPFLVIKLLSLIGKRILLSFVWLSKLASDDIAVREIWIFEGIDDSSIVRYALQEPDLLSEAKLAVIVTSKKIEYYYWWRWIWQYFSPWTVKLAETGSSIWVP